VQKFPFLEISPDPASRLAFAILLIGGCTSLTKPNLPESSAVYRRHHQFETDPRSVARDPAARFFNPHWHGDVLANPTKLASYPRQNGLAVALREFGRIERTLFALDWLLDKNLRQRVTAGLNKGELKNTLAKAVIVQADSILWWLRLSCGTPFISNWRSDRFASRVAKLTTVYSSMWRPSIGTTST